jgi:hypothetical protein
VRRLGMLARSLGMLLSLGRVFLPLRMVILAVLFCSRAMGLCCGFVVFRRLGMCLLHDDCSSWSENADSRQVGRD